MKETLPPLRDYQSTPPGVPPPDLDDRAFHETRSAASATMLEVQAAKPVSPEGPAPHDPATLLFSLEQRRLGMNQACVSGCDGGFVIQAFADGDYMMEIAGSRQTVIIQRPDVVKGQEFFRVTAGDLQFSAFTRPNEFFQIRFATEHFDAKFSDCYMVKTGAGNGVQHISLCQPETRDKFSATLKKFSASLEPSRGYSVEVPTAAKSDTGWQAWLADLLTPSTPAADDISSSKQHGKVSGRPYDMDNPDGFENPWKGTRWNE